MRLEIKAKNFRSFPEIDWTLPDGLTLIDGANKTTGGSNFSGKSSLCDAWFWARYGWLPRWGGPKGGQADSVLRRKDGAVVGGTSVRIIEQNGSDKIEIERRRPNKLTVFKNDIEIPGIDQKALDELLGMDAQRFLVTCYLPQRRNRSFFWMSDSDRLDLLSQVVGLNQIENAALEAKALKQAAERKVEENTFRREVVVQHLAGLPEHLARASLKVAATELDLKRAQLEEHQASMRLDEVTFEARRKAEEEVQEEIDQLTDVIADCQFTLKAYRAALELKEKEQLSSTTVEPEYQAKVDAASRALSEALWIQKSIERFEKQKQDATAAINAAMDLACPTCKQLMPEGIRYERILFQETLRSEAERELALLQRPDLPCLEKELDQAKGAVLSRVANLAFAPSQLKSEMMLLRSQIAEKATLERSAQKSVQDLKDQAKRKWQQQESEARHALETAVINVAHLAKALKADRDSHHYFIQQEHSLRADLDQIDQALFTGKIELAQALDLVEVFGAKGFRSVCFEGVVERIGQRAGELLSIMTASLYSTRLEQISQDSKGNQKLVLKPVIIRGGAEVPLDDLSGGAEERAALAYDVAVAESAGQGLPLILDEVFGGLDAVGKTEAMALLEEVSRSRPVLVIDHSSEFKALFSQVIKVTYEHEESRLESA